MPIPYAMLKALEGEVPFLDKSRRSPKAQSYYLMKGNMEGIPLGACLDSCRWGGQRTILYEMSVKGLIGFIQNWMSQNEGNHIWHERKIEELYTRFELPLINNESCPRDKEHKGTIMDLGGRLRCSETKELLLKPTFIQSYNAVDSLSQTLRTELHESKPTDPLPEEAFDAKGRILSIYEHEWEQYQRNLRHFEEEEKVPFSDVCYAIISEKGLILPLETILKRLNLRPEQDTVYCNRLGPCRITKELTKEEKAQYDILEFCPGHLRPHNKVEFPFDGWDLAFYVQTWYEQAPNPPIFEK